MSDQTHDSREGEGTTVAEAARLLSITEGAVRKRVERGKLAAEHTTDGRLVVYLDATTTHTTRDTTHDRPRQSRHLQRSLVTSLAALDGPGRAGRAHIGVRCPEIVGGQGRRAKLGRVFA